MHVRIEVDERIEEGAGGQQTYVEVDGIGELRIRTRME